MARRTGGVYQELTPALNRWSVLRRWCWGRIRYARVDFATVIRESLGLLPIRVADRPPVSTRSPTKPAFFGHLSPEGS